MPRLPATLKETRVKTRLGESSDDLGTRLGESSDEGWQIDQWLSSSQGCCGSSLHCGYCSTKSQVNKGSQVERGSHFAKWLSPQASERARLFLQRQAVVASELSSLVASHLDSAEPWIVFPRWRGSDLQRWLAQQPQSLPRVQWVAIAAELLEQLRLVHAAGYVHGRLSAEHVWLTDDEQVRLIGLGACHPIGQAADETWLTQGAASVAARYLPPEHFTQPRLGESSDGNNVAARYLPPKNFGGAYGRVQGSSGSELTSASDIYSAAVIIDLISGGQLGSSAVGRCMMAENPYDRPTARELVELLSSYHMELVGVGLRAA